MATTPNTTTYEFNQVTVSFGTVLMDGFQDGEGVEIEFSTEAFTKHVGADGKVTRAKTHDESATIYIRLMQTSAQNDILSTIHNADKKAPGGGGILPIYIRDRNGRSLHTAPEAWIVKMPTTTYDRGPTMREWQIDVARLESFVGGN